MSELKITSDSVLAAAQQCPDAANVLKTLFPEVFAQKLQHGTITEMPSSAEVAWRYIWVSKEKIASRSGLDGLVSVCIDGPCMEYIGSLTSFFNPETEKIVKP